MSTGRSAPTKTSSIRMDCCLVDAMSAFVDLASNPYQASNTSIGFVGRVLQKITARAFRAVKMFSLRC